MFLHDFHSLRDTLRTLIKHYGYCNTGPKINKEWKLRCEGEVNSKMDERGMSEAMTHQFLRLSLASSWAPTSNVIPLLLGGVLLILPTSRHPSCMRTHTHTLTIKRICTHMTSVLQLRDINCAEQGTQYTCAHTHTTVKVFTDNNAVNSVCACGLS